MPSFLTMMCVANLAESSFYHQEQLKPRHEPPADPTTSKHTTYICGHHEAHRHQIGVGHPKACSDSRDEVKLKVYGFMGWETKYLHLFQLLIVKCPMIAGSDKKHWEDKHYTYCRLGAGYANILVMFFSSHELLCHRYSGLLGESMVSLVFS
ncbi:uncharacterized protein [Triticum aestivum]|uniref:uncharacterized protein isoform X1 n=1 Tax=Triticum aestivum TaxID=4565 RepID=UPI001D01ADF9|nr:uncharacterized protein LOC123147376 isoform X1 [Triticum aestivum]